jgi:hypothetical protein
MSTPLAAVPAYEDDSAAQLDLFEGKVVQRYRIAPGSIPEFASVDENGAALKLEEGDIVVCQVEVFVTGVQIGAGYKGGVQTKTRDRIHVGKVIEGSQQVVAMVRKNP